MFINIALRRSTRVAILSSVSEVITKFNKVQPYATLSDTAFCRMEHAHTLQKIYLHSYSLREASIEDVIAIARESGYDGIELHASHFDPENVGEGVKRATALAQENDLVIGCLDYSGDFTNGDPSTRESSITRVECAIDACATQGIPMANGFAGWIVADMENWSANGSAFATNEQFDLAASAFNRLAHYGAARNVRVCVEVHMNTLHDSIGSAHKLIELATHENLYLTIDPGNTFAVDHAEKDPAALNSIHDHVGYAHFKNCVRLEGYDYNVGLADGDINLSEWLEGLDEISYDGPLCIEYCGDKDPETHIKEDIAYLRQLRAQT